MCKKQEEDKKLIRILQTVLINGHLKHRIYIFLSLSLLFLSCRKENENPSWDMQVLAPLLKSSMNIGNLVPDSLLKSNADSSLKLVYENNLYKLPVDSVFSIPDTSNRSSVKLDSIKIGDRTIVYPITLGRIATQAGTNGQIIINQNGNFAFIPPFMNISSGDIDIDGRALFQSMTLIKGFMDITIRNSLPIDITNLTFQLKNKSSGVIIAQQTFPLIAKGDSAKSSIPLAGKTVEGLMLGKIVNLDSPGSMGLPVLIDTSKAITTVLTVRDLYPQSATAVFPKQDLVNKINKIQFKLNQVRLTRAKIRSGQIKIDAYSTLQDTVRFTYKIPSATILGDTFEIKNIKLPPASPGSVSSYSKTVDISGYNFNMKGPSGDTVNTMYSALKASIDSTGKVKTISLNDSIYFNVSYQKIVPEYAKGYLGSDTFGVGSNTMPIQIFNKIKDGDLKLEKVNMKMVFQNGIGADARISIRNLTAYNTVKNISKTLTGSALYHPINMIRAQEIPGGNPPVNFSEMGFSLNASNSNIKDLIEIMPDKVGYSLHFNVNPKGNISGGNDFIYHDYGINAKLLMEIPLSMVANRLTLSQNSNFSLGSKAAKILDGKLILLADNGFPLDAEIQLYLLDGNGIVKDSLFAQSKILAAPVNANFKVVSPRRSKLEIPLGASKMSLLRNTKQMKVVARFTTNPGMQFIKIYSNYSLDFTITGDFNYLAD